MTSHPSLSACGGRLDVSIFLHHLSRVPWSLTASSSPRIVFSLRAPLLGRLLLGAPLPVPSSLVFLPLNTRWSVLWLVRCSKIPVGGSFSGSRLDSPVSISDSPLVGLRPFLRPMFHPELPFYLLALRYWLTLLLHTSTFHLSLPQHTTGLVPSDELGFCTSLLPVIIVIFVPNKPNYHNASGPVVSHACSRQCHH